MNKNFALFLLLVVFIAAFAVAVMVHVPRKAMVLHIDGSHAIAGNSTAAPSPLETRSRIFSIA